MYIYIIARVSGMVSETIRQGRWHGIATIRQSKWHGVKSQGSRQSASPSQLNENGFRGTTSSQLNEKKGVWNGQSPSQLDGSMEGETVLDG